MLTNAQEVIKSVSYVDETLTIPEGLLRTLNNKRIRAANYDRAVLFKNMADGKVSLFHDYPSPLIATKGKLSASQKHTNGIADHLKICNTGRKYRVQTGPSETYKYYRLNEIVEKWKRQKAILSITDLDIRDTPIERIIDPSKLSSFNLLCECDEAAASLEMMTLVVSTKNNFTDSHSDDNDGSNHCFVGKKLWFAWDTHEGLRNSLEDCERVPVQVRSKFDMKKFLSLPSACWFIVEEGQTLFLPGHLTHKVITLENYIGVGSFYVSFPNCLRTLSRWSIHKPNWAMNEPREANQTLTDNLTAAIGRKLKRRRSSTSKKPDAWGFDYLPYSIEAWERQYDTKERKRLLANSKFKELIDMIPVAVDTF